MTTPSAAYSTRLIADDASTWIGAICGTLKAGCGPKKNRPMNVAVPVASATGRKVRTLTSGIISSMANITPPIGVLNVAAMPAPAPDATRMMRWPADMRMIWPSVEPSAEPIWMIGPSRPTAAPLPIAIAEASDFTTATTGRITPLP